jgi:uncharacterized protein YkwD
VTRFAPLYLTAFLFGAACVGDIDDGAPTGAPTPERPGRTDRPGRPSTPDSPSTPTNPGTPSGGIDCRKASTWPADWVAFEDRTLELINERRAAGATCGDEAKAPVGPLKMDPDLREASRCHSLDMAQKGYFSHDSQDGSSPWDRIDDAGYPGFGSGENIIAGTGTPESSVQGWMDSPGHCGNIMSDASETGVGYAFREGSPFGHYGTQTFGRP